MAKFDPQSSLLVLFSFVLANESTPLLLLFTFGSVFVCKCEQKQSTLIINYFLLVLFSFVLANESTPLLLLFTFGSAFGSAFVRKCEQKQSTLILILLTISCWCCFRSYLQTKALHSYYYLLLALFSFVSANKSNPL